MFRMIRVGFGFRIVSGFGGLIITCTILGVPSYNSSIMGPATLFYLLRPL